MQTITISDGLYERLGKHAVGFDTPESVIEKILNQYEQNRCEPAPVVAGGSGERPIFGLSKPTFSMINRSLDTQKILKIHNDLFTFLRERDVIFMPRQKDGERLRQGYWFIGNDDYLGISFYTGGDSSNKTPNLTFHVYLSDYYLAPMGKSKSPIPLCCIQLSNTPESMGWETKKPVIDEIMSQLGGFECNRMTDAQESRWNRYYESRDYDDTDYLGCLEDFLTRDKPIIDEIVTKAKNPEIGFLDRNKAERKINVIERLLQQC